MAWRPISLANATPFLRRPPQRGRKTEAVNSVEFDFHGNELDVVPQDGKVFVVVKRACEYLGVDIEGQRKKLKQAKGATTSMMEVVANDGRVRSMLCLELDSLPIWLARIEESKVRPELRNKLAAYQLECAHALRDRFFGSKCAPTPAAQPAFDIGAFVRALGEENRRATEQLLTENRRCTELLLAPQMQAIQALLASNERLIATHVQSSELQARSTSPSRIALLEDSTLAQTNPSLARALMAASLYSTPQTAARRIKSGRSSA